MSKDRLNVYFNAALSADLNALAARRKIFKSQIVEAALAAFLSPDAADQREAAFVRRLDRLSRAIERPERDQTVAAEALALFVKFWLTTPPPLPDAMRDAANAKGRERYEKLRRIARTAAGERQDAHEARRSRRKCRRTCKSRATFQPVDYLRRLFPRLNQANVPPSRGQSTLRALSDGWCTAIERPRGHRLPRFQHLSLIRGPGFTTSPRHISPCASIHDLG